ncbi:MAG: HDIG domain-containing protein [Candidatus Omnitrophica bacterium]|nr:HDIG domain-containing protein [Candidatus Omnitrophota bacterium]MDD5591669.1 HDIG domain-containing protein [Candidatus Omnitrophota bacterium]
MIKSAVISRLKTIIALALIFALSYILEVNWIIPLFLSCIVIYLKSSRLNYNLLHLSLLYVIIFVVSYAVIKQGWPAFYIPLCALSMLAAILFSELELSLLLTLASSISIAYLAHDNYLGILFLTSGILSGILVRNGRRRSVIIRSGFLIGLLQMLMLFLIDRFKISYPAGYLMFMLNGIISGVIVIGVLPIFEYLFGKLTNISLLELADFNQPLLQRMVMEAPGTYHHSLIVGNLSEVACAAVGANALLARIGAYYHDIGKLQKPEYFSENQDINANKHDTLTPTMSKLIIMNHVNEGIELARKYKLSPRLIDFVSQHHGTSLVYYFYRKALENLEEDQQIREEGFRYPGPKPKTKEAAIVLLADSVEAATRALKEPAPANIQDLVQKVINNKFIDGQLDECDLTLKDLDKISAIFIRILSGICHARITYPEGPKSENSHKKSAKGNSHHSLDESQGEKSTS